MYILIYTCCLGLAVLVGEVLNLRRLLVPIVIVGLAAILGLHIWSPDDVSSLTLGGISISHMVGVDSFSFAFTALGLIGTALFALLSGSYFKNEPHHLSDYLAILIFILCGAMVLFSFNSLVMLFLGIEIVSISLYILAGSRKHDVRSNEAGFKYFLLGAFASGILLFGMALVYAATQSFELSKILDFATSNTDHPLFQTGVTLMLLAMCFKVAAAPFHFWSPDVYEGSPAWVTALMASLVKVAYFAAFYRFAEIGLGGTMANYQIVLLVVTALTILIGNLSALRQDNVKRLLAYSGIANAGYMMLAVISVATHSGGALFFFSVAYILANLGAFAIAIPVFSSTGSESIDAFDGLGKKNPLLAACLTLSLLSIAGIPPMAGFLGKYYLFAKAIEGGYLGVTLLAVVGSVIGVYYYFKLILAMYTKPADHQPIHVPDVYWVVTLICVGAGLLIGLFPTQVFMLV